MDLTNRNIRVSLANTCNFRCNYCDGPLGIRNKFRPGAMEDFRSKPLKEGNITTETYLKIIEVLADLGFGGIALTGGEPLLNKDWGFIVEKSREFGMLRANLTTNGMLLKRYIDKNKSLPNGLTLLNISLDTVDSNEFRKFSGGVGDLDLVFQGLKLVKKTNPKTPIRANKVGLKSTLNNIVDYIKYCENSGFIDEINFLSLIRKSDKDHNFFKDEYISAQKIKKIIENGLNCHFKLDEKFEYVGYSPKGLKIVIKDTNLTMRHKKCEECTIYCQEGFYTVRVATDGTIMICPDYTASTAPIEYIDAVEELNNGNLKIKLKEMIDMFSQTNLNKTINKFFKFYY